MLRSETNLHQLYQTYNVFYYLLNPPKFGVRIKLLQIKFTHTCAHTNELKFSKYNEKEGEFVNGSSNILEKVFHILTWKGFCYQIQKSFAFQHETLERKLQE